MHYELHGFADAFNVAYAAAVYIRLISLSGEISVKILVAKSKVAPIKILSIPRLELSATVQLSRLLEFVRNSLHLFYVSCHCWTDSTVVLAWLSQHPSKWKTFVANRMSEIQSRVPASMWRHIPSSDNPADCASRGLTGAQLISHHLWWQGPTWLRLSTSDWPSKLDPTSLDTLIDQSPRAVNHLVQSIEPWDLASRYSSWPKLIRITAYIMKFISRIQNLAASRSGLADGSVALSANECQAAREFWLIQI